MSSNTFFTKQTLLPQSQNARQLSAWLSQNHPGYNLVAWCFFGNLINNKGVVEAVSSIVQFIREPEFSWLSLIGLRPYMAGFMYCGANTDGYLISGSVEYLNEGIAIVPDPWSITITYDIKGTQCCFSMSLLSGTFGVKGAEYMLVADVLDSNLKRIKADIVFTDILGVVSEGFSPSGFLPQWITQAQHNAISEQYNNSVAQYLDTTGDEMIDQGSYYYSIPLLEVSAFKITDADENVQSEGTEGTIWFDYVVQSYNDAAFKVGESASWEFFAMQFPDDNAALMLSIVNAKVPEQHSGDFASQFSVAKYFNSNSGNLANGALTPAHEWKMNEIDLEPVKSSIWKSPKTGAEYYMEYTVNLTSQEFPGQLTLSSIRDNQEADVMNTSKYEGIFTVQGTIGGKQVTGYAWGELHAAST